MSVLINDEGTMAVGSNAIFNITGAVGGTGTASAVPGAAPTSPLEKSTDSLDIAAWGEANDFPTQVRKDVEENTILATALEWKARAWYGGGLVYGLVTIDDSGEEVFKRVQLPEVDNFLNRSRRYAYEAFLNISYYANGFPELILTKDRSKIYSICEQDAEFCRFAKPDKTGLPGKIYINANWANGGKADDKEFTTQVPVLDPYFDTPEMVKARKDPKFIYPISVPSPGKTLYQLASWNTIRRSKWLDVIKSIPEFKKKLFENQLSLKYLIEVHALYWVWKYGDWEAKEPEERKRLIKEELDTFNKVMSGTEGAGKSVMTTTIPNPRNPQEHIPAFKVTAIDDKIKSGLYVEDSQEASSHVYTAVGVAPTLMGISPGKGMGAGSGSDARVAFNNFISTSKFVQDLVLEPLHFVRDYNGWPANLQFRFQNPLIMTLDKGKQTQQEAA